MTTYTITIPAAGAVAANSLNAADFTNAAGTSVSNTTWTTGAALYFFPTNSSLYAVRSVGGHDTRDHEVTTWMRSGYVFLRLDSNGRAIYFFHNGESSANGTLDIGIVTGLTESSYPSGTLYELYSNDDLVGTMAGYTKTATDGDAFTFGVSGFDIYVEYNGVEVIRFQDYRHVVSGSVAFKTTSSFGFRDITHETLATASIFSDIGNDEIDLRDFHVRALQTTGTISMGAPATLTVASNPGFVVGDYVIVEIGTESGLGARGTLGVGGSWPTLSYANAAARDADVSQPDQRIAYLRDTGLVYWWTGTTSNVAYPVNDWIGQGTNEGFAATGPDSFYYANKALPLSLQARITNIAGTTFTLDTAASAAATNADVYLDNNLFANYVLSRKSTLEDITPDNMTIIWPAGTYALGGTLFASSQVGWTIQGGGQASTTIFSPDGMRGAGLFAQSATGMVVKDFTLTGNLGLSGFGLNFNTTLMPDPNTQFRSDGSINAVLNATFSGAWADQELADPDSVRPGNIMPGAISLSSNDAVVQDVTVNDTFNAAIAHQFGSDCQISRCTINVTEEVQSYIQWAINMVNTTGGTVEDCTFTGYKMSGAFESFVASGATFRRCHTVNGLWSLNNAGDWLVEDCTAIIQANSLAVFVSVNNPIVSISVNAPGGFAAAGGIMQNMQMSVQGYIDGSNNIARGIIISVDNPNVTISGGSYSAPDWAAPGSPALPGGQGILSLGTNTNVDHFTCCTTISTSFAPGVEWACIGVTDGSVKFSTSNTIVAPTQVQNASCRGGRPSKPKKHFAFEMV